jgi:ubiquinone/menaquinone biosynthesis C-methylase UbiE
LEIISANFTHQVTSECARYLGKKELNMASYRTILSGAVEGVANKISARSRREKHQLFLSIMQPAPDDDILDIGANSIEYSESDNYLERYYSFPEKITIITLDNPHLLEARYPKVKVIQADGRRLPFSDNKFEIVYSNAVIEHVGTDRDQEDFLRESVRVAKRGYLTTPNKLFPIEVHTRVPLLHFLPKVYFDRFLHWIGKSWAAGSYMNLLTKSRLERTAASAGLENYKIYSRHFLGITMTYVLVWDKDKRL